MDRATIIKSIMSILEECEKEGLNKFRVAREIYHRIVLPWAQRVKTELECLKKVKSKPRSRGH